MRKIRKGTQLKLNNPKNAGRPAPQNLAIFSDFKFKYSFGVKKDLFS